MRTNYLITGFINQDTRLIPGEGLVQFRIPACSLLYTSDQKLDVVG
jgi:hypothetical protein